MQEERLPKLIMEWIPGERRKRGRPKKNVDGRRTSNHGNKTSRGRSVVKQKRNGVWVPKRVTKVKKKKNY
jgi:hypothetical protein